MFIALRPTRKNRKRNAVFIVGAVLLSVVIFILFCERTSDTRKIFSFPVSPSPSATPAPTLTPTPIPTNTPTPTAIPTSTPTPLPIPTPTSWPTTSFETYFDEYSTQFQVSKDLLKKIAFCESGMNPSAVNGQYGGMYQFTVETWQVTRTAMNLNTNPDLRFNAEESIKTAAFKIANKGESAWTNCL